MDKTIGFQLNGEKVQLTIDPGHTLLWILRNNFGLTGTKFGCGIGFCGAHTRIIMAIETASIKIKGGTNL